MSDSISSVALLNFSCSFTAASGFYVKGNRGFNPVSYTHLDVYKRQTIKFYEQLIPYAKEKGIKVATPNCRWNNYVHSDPVWELVHGYLKDLYIKYDPSHCNYDGNKNPLGEVKRWADRIVHVHLKGTMHVNGERYEDPPAGMDQFDWPAFIAMLYSIHYDGTLSIESHKNWSYQFATTDAERAMADKGIDFTIKYMRQFIF